MDPVPLWSSFDIFFGQLSALLQMNCWENIYWKNIDAASEWGSEPIVFQYFLFIFFHILLSPFTDSLSRKFILDFFLMLPQKRVEPIVLRIDRSTRRWLWLWLSVCQHTDTDLTENPQCPRSTLFDIAPSKWNLWNLALIPWFRKNGQLRKNSTELLEN